MSAQPSFLQSILKIYGDNPTLLIVPLAWAVLLPLSTREGTRLLWRDRLDAIAFVALTAAALILHLLVPYGPLGFVEPERLNPLWSTSFGVVRPFAAWSTLLGLLRALGVPPALLFRFGNPVAGALGVGFTFALARAAGLSRGAAVAGACILLAWPAHVRYSAAADLVIPGSALWTAALAAALAAGIDQRTRLPLLIAACVVGCELRPEYTVYAAAVVVLAQAREGFTRGWFILAASALGLVVAGRLATNASLAAWNWSHASPFELIRDYRALFDASITPVWWVIAGMIGLVFGRLALRARLAFAAVVVLLALMYATAGGEDNPLFGLSRYSLSFVPLLAIGAAALIERHAARAAPMFAVVALLSVPLYAGLLRHPVNMQLELAYMIETAPKVLADIRDVIILDEPPVDGHAGQWVPWAMPALPIGLSVAPVELSFGCPNSLDPAAVRIWPAPTLFGRCAAAVGAQEAGKLVAYIGAFRPEASWTELQARVRLVPIDERTLSGASLLSLYDRQCPPVHRYVGAALQDCPIHVGWYRVEP
jgi:hypothetical protein